MKSKKGLYFISLILCLIFLLAIFTECRRIFIKDKVLNIIGASYPNQLTLFENTNSYCMTKESAGEAIIKIFDDFKEKNAIRINKKEADDFILTSEYSLEYGNMNTKIYVSADGKMLFNVHKYDVRHRTLVHNILFMLNDNDNYIYYVTEPDDKVLSIIDFIKKYECTIVENSCANSQ